MRALILALALMWTGHALAKGTLLKPFGPSLLELNRAVIELKESKELLEALYTEILRADHLGAFLGHERGDAKAILEKFNEAAAEVEQINDRIRERLDRISDAFRSVNRDQPDEESHRAFE